MRTRTPLLCRYTPSNVSRSPTSSLVSRVYQCGAFRRGMRGHPYGQDPVSASTPSHQGSYLFTENEKPILRRKMTDSNVEKDGGVGRSCSSRCRPTLAKCTQSINWHADVGTRRGHHVLMCPAQPCHGLHGNFLAHRHQASITGCRHCQWLR